MRKAGSRAGARVGLYKCVHRVGQALESKGRRHMAGADVGVGAQGVQGAGARQG